ncbi:MAG: DUF1501 domain-containing protein [Deltaproteobacteria bacterium]|nr:DUF1501 domain-containing protein [Deltaproteobacteria bacterium]
MSITRRQFIKRTGVAAAGALVVPNVWRHPFVRRAFAETIGDRFFISLFLDGGNDGLNTVVPVSDGSMGTLRTFYEGLRTTGAGGLQLSPTVLNPYSIGNDNNPNLPMATPRTHTPLAVHPGLAGLKTLYDLGKVAVIQGCGYPDYSLSHDTSRKTWQTATLAASGPGWVGRYLESAGYTGNDIPALDIDSEIAADFQQGTTSVIAVDDLENFIFPYDGDYSDDDAAKRTAFAALYAQAASSVQAARHSIGSAGAATLGATDNYPGLNDLYNNDRPSWVAQYNTLDRSTGYGLREIAKVIYGIQNGVSGINARHFQLNNGGYDTHSNQGAETGAHFDLHQELGNAIELFYNDIANMAAGLENKVLIIVWSEFSRRPEQNDSGTDHGSQGPMFVIGGGVNGGVYGSHPNIDPAVAGDDGNTAYSQDPTNPYRSTDIRDVYGTILKHWLNMGEPTIFNPMAPVLTLDSGDPNLYWTAHNFDLGFV